MLSHADDFLNQRSRLRLFLTSVAGTRYQDRGMFHQYPAPAGKAKGSRISPSLRTRSCIKSQYGPSRLTVDSGDGGVKPTLQRASLPCTIIWEEMGGFTTFRAS